MSKYAPQQLIEAAEECEAQGVSYAGDMLREYAAHLAAQAEWPSDAVDKVWAKLVSPATPSAVKRTSITKEDMRAALTAVWHNRPAQEKAEPVSYSDALELAEEQAILDGRDDAPPAERVRVPFPMAESNAPDHLGPDEKQTYADGFNACRELVLSAAPEADHD